MTIAGRPFNSRDLPVQRADYLVRMYAAKQFKPSWKPQITVGIE